MADACHSNQIPIVSELRLARRCCSLLQRLGLSPLECHCIWTRQDILGGNIHHPAAASHVQTRCILRICIEDEYCRLACSARAVCRQTREPDCEVVVGPAFGKRPGQQCGQRCSSGCSSEWIMGQPGDSREAGSGWPAIRGCCERSSCRQHRSGAARRLYPRQVRSPSRPMDGLQCNSTSCCLDCSCSKGSQKSHMALLLPSVWLPSLWRNQAVIKHKLNVKLMIE